MRILIVEDNKELCEYMKGSLQKENYAVDISKLQRKALEAAFFEICDIKEDGNGNDTSTEKERIYRALKEHFEDRFDNYKRLSAYLSHEQKNALALLRAKLAEVDLRLPA